MNTTIVPFWKTLTFWISLCAWFVTVGGHYVGVIPDPYGIIAANVVALIYAILRCLVKRKEGLPWKGILGTSEFMVTSGTVALNLINALAQVPSMPPKVLVSLSAASGLLVTALHHLSGSNSFESKVSNEELAKIARVGLSLGEMNEGSQTQGSQTQGSQTQGSQTQGSQTQGSQTQGSQTQMNKIVAAQPGAPNVRASDPEAQTVETPLERPAVLKKG
jgi:hypothetical protein